MLLYRQTGVLSHTSLVPLFEGDEGGAGKLWAFCHQLGAYDFVPQHDGSKPPPYCDFCSCTITEIWQFPATKKVGRLSCLPTVYIILRSD